LWKKSPKPNFPSKIMRNVYCGKILATFAI
jgi:hypothetical protein